MADAFQFDLVSPERRLARLKATEVQIPAADGDMTAMADHAPTITTLRPGLLQVIHADGTDEYVVSGGFAEISAGGVSVLAEQALPKGEVTQDIYGKMLSELRAAEDKARKAASADQTAVDEAAKLVADMVAVGDKIGLTSA